MSSDFGDLAARRHVGRLLGDVEQRHAAVGAGDLEGAVAVGDVRLRGFEEARGDLAALLQHLVDRIDDGVAHHHGGARGDRGEAIDLEPAVAVPVLHELGIDAEPLRHQPRKHRGMALAGRLHAEAEHQGAVARKAQGRAFGRRAAGMFEEAGNSEAAIFAALGRFPPPCAKSGNVAELQRLFEDRREIAAVVDGADRRLVRNCGAPDEVAAAQLDPVDAADARGLVHHPFEHIVRLGSAGAPIRPERHRVGQDAPHVDLHARNVVHAGEAAREIVGLDVHAERAEKAADAGQMANAQGEKPAVGVERKLGLRHGVARLIVAEERFAARRHPMHRPADPPRRNQEDRVFRVDRGLHAERAADVVGQHGELLALQTHDRQ